MGYCQERAPTNQKNLCFYKSDAHSQLTSGKLILTVNVNISILNAIWSTMPVL